MLVCVKNNLTVVGIGNWEVQEEGIFVVENCAESALEVASTYKLFGFTDCVINVRGILVWKNLIVPAADSHSVSIQMSKASV
jgi:hypothetical protein